MTREEEAGHFLHMLVFGTRSRTNSDQNFFYPFDKIHHCIMLDGMAFYPDILASYMLSWTRYAVIRCLFVLC